MMTREVKYLILAASLSLKRQKVIDHAVNRLKLLEKEHSHKQTEPGPARHASDGTEYTYSKIRTSYF